jgi:hypothetical protein
MTNKLKGTKKTNKKKESKPNTSRITVPEAAESTSTVDV